MTLLAHALAGHIGGILKLARRNIDDDDEGKASLWRERSEIYQRVFRIKRFDETWKGLPGWAAKTGIELDATSAADQASGSIIAELQNGTLALFGFSAAPKWAKKLRAASINHARWLLTNDVPQVEIGLQPLPPHIRLVLEGSGINASAAATLAWLLGEAAFSVDKRRFHLIASFSSKERQRQREQKIVPRWEHQNWTKTTIRLPGTDSNPDSRITMKGISVKTILPEAIRNSLIGLPLGKVADIPGLSDRKIVSTNTVTHSTVFRLEGL